MKESRSNANEAKTLECQDGTAREVGIGKIKIE